MTGSGTWTLLAGNTSGGNTYAGATIISPTSTGTLKGGGANVFSANSAVTISNSGTFDIGGFNQQILSLASSSTTATVTNSGSSSPAVLSIINNTASAIATVFAGTIVNGSGSSTTGLTLSATGGSTSTMLLQLTGTSNTYSGPTTINGSSATSYATLQGASIGGNFSAHRAAVTINGYGVLDLGGGNQVILSLNSTSSNAVVSNSGGSPTGPANILTVGSGSYVGAIVDDAPTGLTVSGGTLTVSGSGLNTYSGATTIVNGGTLQGGATNAFSPNSAVSIDGTSTLDLGGFNQTIASLAGLAGAKVTNSGAQNATLTIPNNGTTTYAGNITDGSTNSLALNLSGGALTLTGGGSNYSGGTAIIGGSLIANNGSGLATGVGNVVVEAGRALWPALASWHRPARTA